MNPTTYRRALLTLVAFLVLSVGNQAPRAFGANSLFDTLAAAYMANPANVATPTTPGAMSPADKLGTVVRVRYVITCVPPAYTKTGSAGSEVLTANANGELPASCTDGVTGVTGDQVGFPYNDTSPPDAGVFTLTQGTGGTPWILTRTTTEGLNTAARLQGSTWRVLEGFEAGILVSRNPTISAVGTDALLWRPPGPPTNRWGFYANAQFSENSATIAKADLNGGVTAYSGWLAYGVGSTGSNAGRILAGVDGTATGGTGIVANTGAFQLATRLFDTSLSRTEWEEYFKFEFPVASDGSNAFTVQFGLGAGNTTDHSRVTVVPTVGAALNWVTTAGGVAGNTLVLGTLALNTPYRVLVRKRFSATTAEVWWDNGNGVLALIGSTSALPASPIGAGFYVVNGVGANNLRTVKLYPSYCWRLDPKAPGG